MFYHVTSTPQKLSTTYNSSYNKRDI